MPSEKAARVSRRKRTANQPLRRRVRTQVAKTRRLLAANDVEGANQAVRDTVVALDKAAQKGAIHPNNAARRKSRIMRQVNQAAG